MSASIPRSSTSSEATLAGLDLADLEAQKLLHGEDADLTRDAGAEPQPSATTPGYEYGVSAKVKLAFLVVYLGLNMALTLHSKMILDDVSASHRMKSPPTDTRQIHCPWSLTTLHATFSSVGCSILYMTGYLKLTKLSLRENLVLVAFSFLFTINIAISVVSLSMVSVPFHQTVRASTPFFTVAAYSFLLGREYSFWTRMSLIPIVLGVAAATYGDMDFTWVGLVLTFLGVILATAKTITTNRILTGSLKLPALELLFRLSPLAALQACTFAYFAGEGYQIREMVGIGALPLHMNTVLGLSLNGCMALLLNITSFQTNKLAGALTLTVSANIKQCLTILLGIGLFHVHLNWFNGIGMMVTAAGAAWFSAVELRAKEQKPAPAPPPLLQLPVIIAEKDKLISP